MKKYHTSYRGQPVDMDLLKFKNQHQVALGNAHMNARGDILGKGGTIVQTREEYLQQREIEQSLPEFETDSISTSVAPSMDTDDYMDAMFEREVLKDEVLKDEVPQKIEEEYEEPVATAPKRAPRKKAE